MALMSSVPNFEEAANVASEFITSVDNLPNEVQHLLQEIKLKEQRCQELQNNISKDQARYIKSALKNLPTTGTSGLSNGQNKSRTSSPAPTPSGSHPKAHLPARIAAAYAEIDSLTNEKIAVAQKIIELLNRTRSRLDSDLSKVRLLQGESPDDVRNPPHGLALAAPSSSPYSGKRSDLALSGIAPIIQIGDNLRSAVQQEAVPLVATSSGPSYNKKRKITTNTSIKLPSPAPQMAHQSQTQQRSRLSRQTAMSRVQQPEEDADADAEGEEDLEGEDAEEDLTLYCFCHKQSYGDMIGCDNPDCPYQWFHISCVGVKQPLPDKWYCPECIKSKGRKGRKK